MAKSTDMLSIIVDTFARVAVAEVPKPCDLQLLINELPFCLRFRLRVESDIEMVLETPPTVIVRARKFE